MSRITPKLLCAGLLSVLVLSAPTVHAAGSAAEQAAARALEIKRLQQRLLMSEALEAAHERDEATDGVRRALARRRVAEESAGARRGVAQRPSPETRGEQTPRSKTGRSIGPLTANGILSYATNRVVNDPNLDDPTRADAQSEPSIATWSNGTNTYVLAAWNDGRGIQPGATLPSLMAYGYSTDGGQTFINPGAPPTPLLGGIWTSDPVVAVNEKTGDFYLCGLFDPATATTDEHGVAVVRATFSGTSINWSTPVVVKSLLEADGFIDKPWIAADSMSGNVYVTYTRFTTSRDSIVFSRSRNQGVTWGPQITLSSAAAAGYVQGSRPAVGPDSVLYVTWKEIGLSAAGFDYMRIRRSNDGGVSFGAEQTVATFFDNFGTGAPGFNREQGISLPSIAVDRSTGANRGRVYVAWNEAVDFYDSIPDTVTTLNESEPVTSSTGSDDTPATAVPFTPGAVIRGSFNQQTDALGYNDFDYYSFSATQGTTYVFWSNVLPTIYTMRILGIDGQTRLAFSGDRFNSPPNQGFIVWTCPLTGTYYLRMAIAANTSRTGYYRVSTGLDTPGGSGQRARDQRDVFVASAPNGSAWSAPVMLTAPQPSWFDNWLPEVAVTGQGAVYALWYDFSDSPINSYGGLSQSYMSRSNDGGITWASLGPVSDYFVNWTFTNSNIIPNQGDYMSLFANATTVYPCWTDGRIGTPDIWAAPFSIGSVEVEIVSVVADTALVTLTWQATGPYPATADVMRADGGTTPSQYQPLGTVTFDANGRVTFADASVLTAAQYRYALRLGAQIMGERTVVTPGRERPAFAFLGATPNPTKKGLRVRFSLPDNVHADIRLYDITGRPLRWRVYQGPGPYDENFGDGLDLKPGVYFLKLSHAGTDIIRRVSIVP